MQAGFRWRSIAGYVDVRVAVRFNAQSDGHRSAAHFAVHYKFLFFSSGNVEVQCYFFKAMGALDGGGFFHSVENRRGIRVLQLPTFSVYGGVNRRLLMKKWNVALSIVLLGCGSVFAQEGDSDEWSFSLGTRAWFAGWELDEKVTRVEFGGPTADPEQDFTTDADPEAFVSFYVDAERNDWRFSLAYGFSGDYDFKTSRTRDTLKRSDIQFMIHRPFAEKFTAGLGIHRIENDGSTDGRRDGIPARDFKYSFTGPEATLGFAQPLMSDGDQLLAASVSGTMGYYMVDDTAGFISEIDDTGGYTWDAGVVAVLRKFHIKAGYRTMYINDSIWSIDQISLGNGQERGNRRVVKASETFSGFYGEVSYAF